MNKFEKIKHLQDIGLNTTKLFLLPKGDESRWNEAVTFINENNGASIRTFADDESILSPHKPNLEKEVAIQTARELMQEYNVILTERVNPAFAIVSGKCNITKEDGAMRPKMDFEFSVGPGAVVRDVDKKMPSELLHFSLNSAQEIDTLAPSFQEKAFKLKDGKEWHFTSKTLDDLCEGVRDACIQMISTKLFNHCFELSIYEIQIGVKQRQVIFWEVYEQGNLAKV
jgi:hypothetical protein